ncbi:MAG: MltA domain-containing protein [Gammaproteobacteria bacterium]|nr:MltA domain-containing protein [Gammaproteobacteria bacterium]
MTLLLPAVIHGCSGPVRPLEPGIGQPVSWERLDGWHSDNHAESWPALLAGCAVLADVDRWQSICRDAGRIRAPTDARARAFFEARFRAHPVIGDDGEPEGLITGYYEPLLQGSFEPDERFKYPLHAPPENLLVIDPGDAHPELSDLQLRGRLQGRTVVPYPTRAGLTASPDALPGSELLWVDDAVDAFFLHVQGSGRVALPDGQTVAVRYADHNGHPYQSIGRELVRSGEMTLENVNLFTIRRWLRAHPGEARALFNHNPRYIFFRLDTGSSENPRGALNVPLTPGRSLAVDRDKLPLGAPVWLATSMPGESGAPLNRLLMAQDTGSAIRGWNRADVFWGSGREAERKAGLMKEPGRLFVLLPK